MTTYEMNYQKRLDEMLDRVIRKYGYEHRVTIFFARLVEKYYNNANCENREIMEKYFKGYVK